MEMAAIQLQDRCRLNSHRVCRPGLAIDQCHFAQNIARNQMAQDQFLPVGSGKVQAHATRGNGQKVTFGIASLEQ